ncbi:leucine--tRNA ligase [Buchnera aphidicola (Mollitrichosiphum nigrofasciatum)]|uniref:leucine--tRNA ligase n=1 Tax=Buchnera aphidicola TaxID=9 RepID=UPI0031B8AE7E
MKKMQEQYLPKKIEKIVQKYWEKNKTFKVQVDKKKEKYYCLAMLPYPSGDLHMGHVRNYTISDVISRYQRMLGKNVLQPIGWDAFGLPAEIAAIENNTKPEIWTKENIQKMKKQLKSLGFSYDWDREIKTCDPRYFYWEQWFFIQLYKKKLVYKKTAPVNWCENDQTILANEQVIKGKCWRCNTKINIKIIPQWFIKITKFAKELLKNIENLEFWPKEVKLMQKNWIGRSKGMQIIFDIYNSANKIKIFTKNLENVINTNAIILSPLHHITKKFSNTNINIKKFINNKNIQLNIYNKYKYKTKKKIFTNKYAINPITKKKIPIWIDKTINIQHSYQTKIKIIKYNINNKYIKKNSDFKSNNYQINTITNKNVKKKKNNIYYKNKKIKLSKIYKILKLFKKIKKKTTFKLRDWSVSRQRHWGTPIPMGTVNNKIIQLPEKILPILLPKNQDIKKKNKITIDNKKITLENETFDTFMESSWYHIRYTCPNYKYGMVEKKSANYWLPIDQYIGGIEHATMHLIYFRFYNRLLYKLNFIKNPEPVIKLLCQGMVLSDAFYYIKNKKKIWINKKSLNIIHNKKGKIIQAYTKKKKKPVTYAGIIKMSKSKKNGISPKKIIKKYGADTIRLFIIFAAPPKSSLTWNPKGVLGIYKFLNRFWKFINKHYLIKPQKTKQKMNQKELKFYVKLQQTITKVTYYIEKINKLNNAVAQIISLVNNLIKSKFCHKKNHNFIRDVILIIIKIFHPFIPHFSFFVWKKLTNKKNIDNENWPILKPNKKKNKITIIIQINGKKKKILNIYNKKTKGEIIHKVIKKQNIKNNLINKKIKKIIYIPNKILNFVI